MNRNILTYLVGTMVLVTTALLGIARSAQAQTLIASDNAYGVPFGQALVVESFGVLENDTLDGDNAGENGATAELVSDVSHGTLECESNPALSLCEDGSFTYTPDASFPGIDTFTYQAVAGADTSQATVTLTACSGGPTVYTCWKEMPYLAKLAELGYSNFQEGFEDNAAWGSVREPNTALSIASQGIVWKTNHPATNEITTGSGPARTGQWGIYDPDHGYATGSPIECDIDNPPVSCLFYDGFTGTRVPGESKLYGVGGFFTGFTGANLVFILDGSNQIDVGKLPDPGHHFLGVLDTNGFTEFEAREIDGKIGQARFIFADDFTFAINNRAMPWIPLLLLGD